MVKRLKRLILRPQGRPQGKPLGRFRGGLIGSLLVLVFALTACAGYANPTPAPAPAVVQSNANAGAVPIIRETPAARPVSQSISPAPTAAPTLTAAPRPRNGLATLAPTLAGAAAPEAPPGLTSNPGFYEFPYADSQVYIHMPPAPPPGRPLQMVMAIHGMGGNGADFGQPLISYADRYGFVLVAPTMKYDPNFFDPGIVAANDETLLPELHALVTDLPGLIGRPVSQRVMLFGFSRGAQIVHRFALFYPEQVKGVALMSAGNYTLPYQSFKAASGSGDTALRFPYGVSDLAKFTGHSFDLQSFRKIFFWIGVGGADNASKDVPAAWNPYLGNTRLERANRFYQALQKSGINATFNVFPGVGHAVCTGMKQDGFAFFNNISG